MGSAEEGHAQALALAWLGVWEAEQGGDAGAARELFQAALEIDPQQATAGAAPAPPPRPLFPPSTTLYHPRMLYSKSGMWTLHGQ